MALSGTGTQLDPYLIHNLADLQEFSQGVGANTYYVSGKYTKLTADIDCTGMSTWTSGAGFRLIDSYYGIFDGNGKTLSNFYVRKTSGGGLGMFMTLQAGSAVRKLKFQNPDVQYSVSAGAGSGILAGWVYGEVSQCCIVGGGYTVSTVTNNCGSLFGLAWSGSSITNCYSMSPVIYSGDASPSGSFGGFVLSGAYIAKCFFASTIVGVACKGFAGTDQASSTGNYYDSTVSGKTDTIGAIPKTTTEMKTQSTFVGWDFENTWIMPTAQYPELRVFYVEPLVITSVSPESVDLFAGQSVDMSVSFSGGSGEVSVSLIDTSDSSVISTVSPYTYVADIEDEGKNFQWSVTDGVSTVESELIPVTVISNITYTHDISAIPEGDPKLFLTASGVDIHFENGLPVMENGLENIVAISLFTETGYILNRIAPDGDTEIGSTFIEESRKSITRNQLSVIEDSAEKALAWAVESGIFSEVSARMIYGGSVGYILTITITPPTGQQRELSFIRHGENWIEQQKKIDL